MGEALENLYGALLCHGPPLENGFFYDSFIGDDIINEESLSLIEGECKKLIEKPQ